MKTRQRLLMSATTTMIAALALTGCAAASETEKPASPAASAPQETDAPSATPATAERQVPASCSALTLALGAQLEGTALGKCVSEALSSYGSGRIHLTADAFGEVEFTYDPTYSFHADLQGSNGPLTITYVNGDMWVDSGSGPVKGDLNSDKPEEQLVAVTGELYRFYSDLEQTATLIAAQPAWRIDDAKDQVSAPSGDTVEPFKIVSDGPFTWNEIPVSEFILWFGDDWTPVGTQATVSFIGTTGTHTQHFYDLGKPVKIEPLS
ncbi:hypothetical protein D9V32_00585 [Mycetocola tolaasinivorans]|uniref:LppX_LprAFG lipoprotein n=1 Tax=Mycetocola tolaasinivorans TaxID=76635 RepID=A0A3L7ABJ6_9MICO|nr:hypothetical protein [Mycetocola tolaasinivorans]RLP77866.1 hypothetical protein D9V32_00585 [Mycetocola tolaasinivorans]